MKTINLGDEKIALEEAIKLARNEPLLLLSSDGKKFLLSAADDLQPEGETFRASPVFEKFLNDRSKTK
jgi:hypothetical protein